MSQTAPTDEIDHELADKVDVFGVDSGETGLAELVEEALESVRNQLADNRSVAIQRGMNVDPDRTVDGVLSPDNVRDIKVHDRPWQDPKVIVWLNDAPMWANDAGNGKVTRVDGRRDLHFVYDCRQF